MIELKVVKRTEEQEYITLHLVPINTVNVSGELFYKVDLADTTEIGDIIAIENAEVDVLKERVTKTEVDVTTLEETIGTIFGGV